MIKTISRAPNDEFTFLLFDQLILTLTCDYEAYYIWSNPPQEFKNFLNQTTFSKSNVIIGIKDLLDLWCDYNFWTDKTQDGIKLLDNLASKHPDKNFIIFTSLENINLELITANNIQYIPWGGDIINQANAYRTIAPVLDKNFDSTKTFISLNRHGRAHRLVTLSYIFGKEYDQFGYISYLGQQIDIQQFDNLLDCIPWQFEERHNNSRDAMLIGYPKFYNNKALSVDNYEIYDESVNNNVSNFNRRLRSKYQNSFVEIVSESSFSAPSFMLTEKTLNSVYGCNFPILLSGVGAVGHLREVGFDVFDDIVDHSYDPIANPFDRIIAAVENNHRLLVDSNYVKKLWKSNQHRFEKNIDLAQNTMYNWYQSRVIDKFNNIIWN
jgi:hypothetical protein